MAALTLAQLWMDPVIAIIRTSDPQLALYQADIVVAAGFIHIEIAATIPDFTAVVKTLRQVYPHITVGTGSMLDISTAEDALQAGVQFLMSPVLNLEMLALAQRHQVFMIPGALTPTEIVKCLNSGSKVVKVFPIISLGGVSYLQQLQKPLGYPPLIPTGGVTLANSLDFLAAGALAVGIGGDLFPFSLNHPQAGHRAQQRLQTFVQSLQPRSTPIPFAEKSLLQGGPS